MSRDTRIGLAGLMLGLFAVAAFYLWPDRKWIGSGALVCAGVLLLLWIVLEFRALMNKQSPGEPLTVPPSATISQNQHFAAAEWKELAARFHAIGNTSIRVDWNRTGDGTEIWNVCGGNRQTCESLCKLAGAMLARSPRVCAALLESTRLQPDHLYRWLGFLKDSRNVVGMGYGEEKDAGGKTTGILLYGSINNLPAVSERACIDCATTET